MIHWSYKEIEVIYAQVFKHLKTLLRGDLCFERLSICEGFHGSETNRRKITAISFITSLHLVGNVATLTETSHCTIVG